MRFLLALVLLLSTCGLWAQGDSAVKISVGDKLSVAVVGYKDFTGIYEVASDGTISGPGIGIIKVAGKTVEEANALVLAKFKETLLDPHVFVGMDSERAKIVYVVGLPPENTGGVGNGTKTALSLPAGQVPLTPSTTIRSLLAGANLSDRPDRLEAVVVRGGETYQKIDLYKLLHEDGHQFDGPLKPNDILIIRAKPTLKVWFVGPFKQPGDHLIPEELTLDQAIGYIGGFDTTFIADGGAEGTQSYLNRSRVELRRGADVRTLRVTPGSPDLQEKIEAGDTLTLVLPQSVNVTVAGFVPRVGEVVVDSNSGAFAAISKAGGAVQQGSLDQVTLFRGTDLYHLNLNPNGPNNPATAMPLQAGDILYVGENKRYVQVLGAVIHAGPVYLPDDKREFHVHDALAAAGGIAPDGSLLRAVLLHPDGTGKYQRTQFNLDKFLKDGKTEADPIVQPGDVLFFGTPKGITGPGLLQVATTAAILYSYGIHP